ncbi:MAG: 1,4-dihydroxy-2-naphthoate octaprenyltransferase [Candidatus Azobacteroides sp.]|nr:1,4-dihydroxy-2-naphthoate octaprenyltransferase [Candidatus Azobacteroides sp.]
MISFTSPVFNAWISALRLRTLCLATACTLLGSGVAFAVGCFDFPILILTVLTAIGLQLSANLANDLGDYQHGTDITGERVGPKRAVQSGLISVREMKTGIMIAVIFAAVSGCLLIYQAVKYLSIVQIAVFLFLGISAIIAALKYTAGNNPYGYRGWGDFFSFLFFGPVAVIGTYFLHVHVFDFHPVLPSVSMGLLTIAVLNVNNMRDIDNDRKSGKFTVPVCIGIKNAKRYHAALIIGACLCAVLYNLIYACAYWYQFAYLVVFIFLFRGLKNIIRTTDPESLDPYLKQTSILTLLFSILFSVCINPDLLI